MSRDLEVYTPVQIARALRSILPTELAIGAWQFTTVADADTVTATTVKEHEKLVLALLTCHHDDGANGPLPTQGIALGVAEADRQLSWDLSKQKTKQGQLRYYKFQGTQIKRLLTRAYRLEKAAVKSDSDAMARIKAKIRELRGPEAPDMDARSADGAASSIAGDTIDRQLAEIMEQSPTGIQTQITMLSSRDAVPEILQANRSRTMQDEIEREITNIVSDSEDSGCEISHDDLSSSRASAHGVSNMLSIPGTDFKLSASEAFQLVVPVLVQAALKAGVLEKTSMPFPVEHEETTEQEVPVPQSFLFADAEESNAIATAGEGAEPTKEPKEEKKTQQALTEDTEIAGAGKEPIKDPSRKESQLDQPMQDAQEWAVDDTQLDTQAPSEVGASAPLENDAFAAEEEAATAAVKPLSFVQKGGLRRRIRAAEQPKPTAPKPTQPKPLQEFDNADASEKGESQGGESEGVESEAAVEEPVENGEEPLTAPETQPQVDTLPYFAKAASMAVEQEVPKLPPRRAPKKRPAAAAVQPDSGDESDHRPSKAKKKVPAKARAAAAPKALKQPRVEAKASGAEAAAPSQEPEGIAAAPGAPPGDAPRAATSKEPAGKRPRKTRISSGVPGVQGADGNLRCPELSNKARILFTSVRPDAQGEPETVPEWQDIRMREKAENGKSMWFVYRIVRNGEAKTFAKVDTIMHLRD